jgi:hypothetical protein
MTVPGSYSSHTIGNGDPKNSKFSYSTQVENISNKSDAINSRLKLKVFVNLIEDGIHFTLGA